MNTKIYTGRATRLMPYILDEIGAAARAGERPILLVPEQYTLQAELDVVRHLNLGGFISLQVLSPTRLSERVFEQTGARAGAIIGASGKCMAAQAILRKLAARDALHYYGKAAGSAGFARKVVDSISQFKRAGLTPRELADISAITDGPLKDKLADISVIWEHYEDFLEGQFVDGEDVQRELLRRLPESTLLLGARVWVYGFDLITAQTAELLIGIIGQAASFTLALTYEEEQAPDGALFEPARATLSRLGRWLDAAGIMWDHSHIDSHIETPARAGDGIHRVDRQLFARKSSPTPPGFRFADDVELVVAPSPRHEAEWAAARILSLYQDGVPLDGIVLLCANLESTGPLIKRTFRKFGIPVYIDEKREAAAHPLFRGLMAALRFALSGERTADLMEWLQFAGILDEDRFALDEYARSHGVDGFKWKYPFNRAGAGYTFSDKERELRDKIEPLRRASVEPLYKAQAELRAASRDSSYARALWQFTVENGIPERMAELTETLERRGMREEAENARQAWRLWLDLLDQLNSLATPGIPLQSLVSAIETGINSIQLSLLPQETGRVLIGQTGRTKLSAAGGVKVIIAMGLADGSPAPGGLLTDRETLETESLLKSTLKNSLISALNIDEKTFLNLSRMNLLEALTTPTELLCVTCTRLPNGDMPPLAKRLMDILPECEKPHGTINGIPVALYAARPTKPTRIRPLPPNRRSLETSLAKRLYTDKQYSVTRLQTFAQCPYAQFVRFGLHPKQIETREVKSTLTGNMMHTAMQKLTERLRAEPELCNKGEEEARQLMRGIIAPLLAEYGYGLLAENAMNRAMGRTMERVMQGAAYAALWHAQATAFAPVYIERAFGMGRAPLTIQIGGADVEMNVEIEGKIDRADIWTDASGQVYFRVIDYKSGKQAENAGLNPTKFILGLDLQLLLYLEAVRAVLGIGAGSLSPPIPAAALHFKVDEPLIDAAASEAQTREKRLGKYKMKGVILDDRDVCDALDSDATPRSLTQLFKKDGCKTKGAPLVTRAQMDGIIRYAMDKAADIAQSVERGDISLRPIAFADYTSCTYCDYRALCEREEDARITRVNKYSFDDLLRMVSV